MEKVNKDGKEQEWPGEHGLGLSNGPEEIPASDAREQTLAWAREKESLSQIWEDHYRRLLRDMSLGLVLKQCCWIWLVCSDCCHPYKLSNNG